MLWFWGLCGAFCYAGPRLLNDVRSGKAWRWSLLEFALALAVGAIFARGFTPTLGYRLPWLVQPNPTALAVGIGLCANAASPYLVRAGVKMTEKLNA